jgi:hypothetical protein
MYKLLATTAVALSLASVPAVAEETPVLPSGKVQIDVSTINGSGCRAGSAAVTTTDDNSGFTVTYSEFLAETGSESAAVAHRKNCQLGLNLHVPPGYAYAVTKVDYRGYAYLAPGAVGLQRAGYYVQGTSRTERSTARFQGPMEQNWTVTDEVPAEKIVWAPCGVERLLNVNTEVRVNPGESDKRRTSYLAMDSTDGTAKTRFQLSWKKC